MRAYTFYWNAERDCETNIANATHVMVLYENPFKPIEGQPSRSWRMFAL